MIIDKNTYFTNELYLPESKRSINNTSSEQGTLDWFIPKYVQDCLLKSLGNSLSKEFISELDSSETNGLKPSANVKWDKLLNGRDYTNKNGYEKSWRGIRFKNSPISEKPDSSFLANYVYFYYEKNDSITRSRVGNVQEQAKNASLVSNYPKAVKAWNDFVDMVQGKGLSPISMHIPSYYNRFNGIYAIDYYSENQEVSLYEFIREINEIEPDTYQKFMPKCWDKINEFNL